MTRRPSLVLAALALAACSPSVPDSGAGVGFQDYNSYIRNAQTAPPPAVVAPPVAAPVVLGQPGLAAPGAGFNPAAAAAAIDRADGRLPVAAATVPVNAAPLDPMAPLDPNRPRGNEPAGIAPQSGEMGAVIGANKGISDEQDFAAVAGRETIESDKARIERNRAQYVVVQPGALPTRPGETGPNIVEYALASTHAPGTPMHNRSRFRKDSVAACARYTSPDLAQEAFLAAGGPDKDKLSLDPDGDGFACDWDPRPFRTALN